MASAIQVGRENREPRKMSRSETEESTEARYVIPTESIISESSSRSSASIETHSVQSEILAEQRRKQEADIVLREVATRSPEVTAPRPNNKSSFRPPSVGEISKNHGAIVSSIDVYHNNMKARSISTGSAGTITEESDEHLNRRVRFGSCKIHPYEPNDSCDFTTGEEDLEETEDLIGRFSKLIITI